MQDQPYRNSRLNLLIVLAFLMVFFCAVVAIWMTSIPEYAKSIVTFLLGRYSGYVDNIYSFEFGTTRGSKEKDEAISNLAAASPIAPSVVTAAAVAAATGLAKPAAIAPGAPVEVVVENVEAIPVRDIAKDPPT
ncbi:MAG: hypothetical protein ABI790_05390 [Betaproteobacteria bacterium]